MQLSIQASGVPLTMDYSRAQLMAFEMTIDSKPKALKIFMKKEKGRKPKKGPGKMVAVCWHCGEARHIKPHCPKKNEEISKGTDGKYDKANHTAFMASATGQEVHLSNWIVDSGATEHMTRCRNFSGDT